VTAGSLGQSGVTGSSELDATVRAHLARMPESTRRLLGPLIAEDAPDPWLREALLAYLRYFTRIFDRGEGRPTAEAALAFELCALIGRTPTSDDDDDVTLAEAELAKRFAGRGYDGLATGIPGTRQTATDCPLHSHCECSGHTGPP
jgi:hypothetical protein